jgi:hypothetical protein
MKPTIDELTIADAPDRWSALGFEVEGDTCVVGDVRIRLDGRGGGSGLTGWSLRGVERTELDGLATTRSDRSIPGERPSHSNGVIALDHVVAVTPALDRTIAALKDAGLDARRRPSAGVLPPRSDAPRGRAGAPRGDRARRG